MDKWWGIEASGTASWNKEINANGELNSRVADATNNIAIRACAVNAAGKFGAWTSGDDGIVNIHIDNAAPTVTVAVNQYSSAITKTSLDAAGSEDGTEIIPVYLSSSAYSNDGDTYLRGENWYLVVKILDESGIKTESGVPSIVVKEGAANLVAGTGYFRHTTTQTVGTETKTGYNLYIPIFSVLQSK